MSKKYKNKKSYKKNRVTLPGPYTLVNKGPDPIPDVYSTKLKFAQVNSNVGSLSLAQIYAGNGIFDPDITGVGLQPKGYDELSILYKRYRVKGSRITVNICNNQTTAMQIVLFPDLEGIAFASPDDALTAPYSKQVFLAQNGAGSSSQKIVHYMNTQRITGDRVTDDALEGLTGNIGTGANPTKVWYWQIFGIDSIGNTTNVQYSTVIEYYVDFFDRKDLDMS